MSQKPLRLGMIGVGGIAQGGHLPYWQELQEEGRIELVAVCDVNPERVQEVQEKFGAGAAYTDYKRMLRSETLDLVDVCTQNRFHCPVTVAALEAGNHVLVEKPIAMNVREADKMIAAANQAKKKLMVAQHFRFESGYEKLHEIATSGALGQIYHANCVMLRRRKIPGWGRFHIKKESLGGPVIDIGVHVLDLVMWFMQFPKPVAVSASVHRMFGDRHDLVEGVWACPYPREEFDVEDYATALIRFENDLTMHFEVSWAANIPDDQVQVRVLGDRAGISTQPLAVYGYDTTALTTTTFDWLPAKKGYREEIRHFTQCVEEDLPVRVQPGESLKVQKIIDAIYASANKRKEVRIA